MDIYYIYMYHQMYIIAYTMCIPCALDNSWKYQNLHGIYPVYTVDIQGILHVYVDLRHIPLIYLV